MKLALSSHACYQMKTTVDLLAPGDIGKRKKIRANQDGKDTIRAEGKLHQKRHILA